MTTTVWTGASTTFIANNKHGQSFRTSISSLLSQSLGQVRVTYQAANASGLTVDMDHTSIGVQSGTPLNTVATPVELKFRGASGFHFVDPFTVASDWAYLSFLSTDTLVVVQDMTSIGNGGSGVIDFNGDANSDIQFLSPGATYNQSSVAGFTDIGAFNFGIILIETQAPTGLIRLGAMQL
jgi:hypothetical protein